MKTTFFLFLVAVCFLNTGARNYDQNTAELRIWTSCPNQGALDVWVDDRLVGTLDKWYNNVPSPGSAGTISIVVTAPGQHKLFAQNKNRTVKWGPVNVTVPRNGLTYQKRC